MQRGIAASLKLGTAVLIAMLLVACQGATQGFSDPTPRSRKAAGDEEERLWEAPTSSRNAIDESGGELEYKLCKIIVPCGAVPEPIFFEIQLPDEPPEDVLPESAYQLNPDGLELLRDALLIMVFYDEDIPVDRDEEDLVIVHSVNGVWIELSNSEVNIHNNTVEAPIRYMGLYALRAKREDPRYINTPPVALFDYSEEPFPLQRGLTTDDAQARETGAGEESQAGKVNVNTAAVEELATIPGLTTVIAERIADYREEHGDFESLDSLLAVNGIDQQQLASMRDLLTITASEEEAAAVAGLVDINNATLSELVAVEGLNEVQAKRIIDYRNQQGAFASVDDLLQVSGINEAILEGIKPQLTVSEGAAAPQAGLIRERRLVAGMQAAGRQEPEAAGNVAEGEADEDTGSQQAALAEGEPAVVGPAEVTAPTPEVKLYFDASRSYDPDGKVVQYDWDFDADGIFDYSSNASPQAEHVFKRNGDYSVVLKVTDDGRYAQSGYGTGLIKIRNASAEPQPLTANIASYPGHGPTPLTVHFASHATGGTPPYVYLWTFSDDSESALPNPFTTYPEPGSYTIRYKVTDIKGEALSGSLQVQVCSPEHPVTPPPRMLLDISPRVERGQAPLTTTFRLSAARAAMPVTYRVSFGDEGPDEEDTVSTVPVFEHVYGNAGFYLVKVVATDAELRTASTFATVHAITPEQARDFTLSELGLGGDPYSFGHEMYIQADYAEVSPRTVKFYPQDAPRPVEELAFQWDFGDGTYSTEAKPEHTYARDGIYEIRLTASDGVQRWRHRIWLPVSSEDPAVAIQRPAYLEGPAPLRMTLDAIVTRGEEPLRYDWRVGDARRSDPSTYYSFQLPGSYEVGLTVYDRHNQPIIAPTFEVRVRPGPVDFRLPLAVVQPVADSTRALVLDYTAANPLPLSSPYAEGAIGNVQLSADGQRLAIVGEDALIVKRVSNGDPVLAFLPAGGRIATVRALELDAAYCTVEGAGSAQTYLLRPAADPLLVGAGYIEDCSGDGGVLVLRASQSDHAVAMTLYTVEASAGVVSEPQGLSKLREARLPRDGRELFMLTEAHRLLKRNLASGDEEYLTGGDDRKHGLAVSADANAVAFASSVGGGEVIYGRYTDEGDFRLASVTDQTGFFSEYLRLSADGRYLLAYGARNELSKLLDIAQGRYSEEEEEQQASSAEAPVAENEEEGEEGKATAELPPDELTPEALVDDEELMPRPPRRRERFGVIRLDLAGAPADWSIVKVNPKFVVECQANFSSAGPFW